MTVLGGSRRLSGAARPAATAQRAPVRMGNAVASGGCRCLWGYSGQDVARAVAAFRERTEYEGPGVGFLVGGGEDARAVAHRGPLALSGEEAAAVAAAVAAARARVERLRKEALVEQLRAAEAAGRGADPNGEENREPTLELSLLRADDGAGDGSAGAGECSEAEAAGQRRRCGCGWPACPFGAPGGSPLDGFQLLCCLISFSCQQDEEKLASLFDLFDFERRGSRAPTSCSCCSTRAAPALSASAAFATCPRRRKSTPCSSPCRPRRPLPLAPRGA